MASQINPALLNDPVIAVKVLDNQNEIEKMKEERGFLGSIWGNSDKIPHNIAASLIFLLVITGICYTIYAANQDQTKILSIEDFWAIISPLITLAIGYLFGDKISKKEA